MGVLFWLLLRLELMVCVAYHNKGNRLRNVVLISAKQIDVKQ